jgi:hypothetical protein
MRTERAVIYLKVGPTDVLAGGWTWTEWFMTKLPLVQQKNTTLYQTLVADYQPETTCLTPVTSKSYFFGLSWYHSTRPLFETNPHVPAHWLVRYYNFIRIVSIYPDMYDDLRMTAEWGLAMQVSPSGEIRPTLPGFLENILRTNHPAKVARWKQNHRIYEDTLLYCINRYVVQSGVRAAATGGADKVLFPSEGVLRAASLRAPCLNGHQ